MGLGLRVWLMGLGLRAWLTEGTVLLMAYGFRVLPYGCSGLFLSSC